MMANESCIEEILRMLVKDDFMGNVNQKPGEFVKIVRFEFLKLAIFTTKFSFREHATCDIKVLVKEVEQGTVVNDVLAGKHATRLNWILANVDSVLLARPKSVLAIEIDVVFDKFSAILLD